MNNEINNIAISGRMVAAAKALSYNGEGHVKMCAVDLAVNKFSSTEKDNKKVEYYHLIAFGAIANRLCNLEKGTALMVNGSISVKENKTNGTTFHNMSIVVSDFTVTHWPANVSDLIISGRVAKEIDLKTSKNENVLVAFDLAVKYYDFATKGEATQFINVVAYRDIAERLSKAVKKGYRIQISGYLTTNVHKDTTRNITYTNNSIVVSKFQVLDQGKNTNTLKKSA